MGHEETDDDEHYTRAFAGALLLVDIVRELRNVRKALTESGKR
jgi:hypothetical protein